jgi:hypothetical protein
MRMGSAFRVEHWCCGGADRGASKGQGLQGLSQRKLKFDVNGPVTIQVDKLLICNYRQACRLHGDSPP